MFRAVVGDGIGQGHRRVPGRVLDALLLIVMAGVAGGVDVLAV